MKTHFLGSKKLEAQRAVQQLVDRYGQSNIASADYLVCIGGDGTALNTLQAARAFPTTPVFAMRLPESVGALGNPFNIVDLHNRLQTARGIAARPLKADATTVEGKIVTCSGINEIVVSRAHLQAAKLHVMISSMWTHRRLTGDGILVATPLGSSGYNQAVGGPLLPWRTQSLSNPSQHPNSQLKGKEQGIFQFRTCFALKRAHEPKDFGGFAPNSLRNGTGNFCGRTGNFRARAGNSPLLKMAPALFPAKQRTNFKEQGIFSPLNLKAHTHK